MPRPPIRLCPGGWGAEMQTLGLTSPATGKVTWEITSSRLIYGLGGVGGAMSNLPSSPTHKPLQVAPPGSLQDTKQLGEVGEGRERGLGTAMANLESSLSHGELHPSAPDAGERVGRGPLGPPTLSALCIQLAFRNSLQFFCGGGRFHCTPWHFRALCELPPPAPTRASCQRVALGGAGSWGWSPQTQAEP